MANKIPIDDLFSEILSEGKEQLNLGAWANMNRMLDGQNPYAHDENEPKKKRRILPFLALFLLLGTAITAGYMWLSHQDRNNRHTYNQVNQQNSNNQQNTDTAPKPTSQNGEEKPNQTNSLESGHTLTDQKTAQNLLNPSETRPQRRFGRKHRSKDPLSYESNNVKGNQEDKNDTNKALPEINPNNSKQIPVSKSKHFPVVTSKETQTELGTAKESRIENSLSLVPKTKNIQQITTKERKAKGRNGNVNKISYDTVGFANSEVISVNEKPQSPVQEPSTDKNFKYHPRYIGPDIQAVQQPIAMNAPVNKVDTKNVSTPTLSNKSETKQQNKQKEKSGFLQNLGNFAGNTFQKIGETGGDFLKMFTVLDPGVSLGVNAALFNKDNYGGFHAGFTNHTSISNMFNIITELKFLIRNNSGFTVNDIKTSIINKNVDSITYASQNQTSYTYQVDSLTKKYNFKSFMSLELPVLLNARFGNLSVYGGPNFVYNFRLKIQEINKKFVIDKEDIVDNGSNFTYPNEKGMQYVRSDFGSRFGIGYAAGVSYNFNPKIYLDIRMSKVVWDNTQTNSARAVSNGVSKVPFTQLSIGYKFLDRSKD